MTSRTASALKCVVWDLDGTLWDGVALERRSPGLPEPRRHVLATVDRLARRGVLSSIASRTAPSLIEAVRAQPDLSERFVLPQLGWHDKSVSLRRLGSALGIATDAMALVDDDSFERAEVAAHLAGVRVLPPDEADLLLEGLPGPTDLTEDARHRVRRYQDEARRSDAEAGFDGTRDAFLRSCRIHAVVRPAVDGDAERIAELVERTHRLNNGCEPVAPAEVRRLLADPRRWLLPVLELSDRFGRYGLVGVALIDRGRAASAHPTWTVRGLATSCRVAGRGAAETLVGTVLARARHEGAASVAVPIVTTSANLELRMLLRRFGFRSTPADATGSTVVLDLGADHPGPPPWVTLDDRAASGPLAGGVAALVRRSIAFAAGRNAAAVGALDGATTLFGPEIALTSLSGVVLLTELARDTGVDVAAEDVNLDALESIDTLVSFIEERGGVTPG